MIRSRNVKVFAVALTTAALLGACGSAPKSTAPQSTTASGSTSVAPPSSSKVTITFWNEMTGPYETALAGEIKAFEAKYPNITVKDVVIPNDAALEPKLLAGIVGHSLPTLSQLNPQWGSHFTATKTIVNLTPYIDKATNFGLSQFYPQMLRPGTWPGNKQYMVPFNLSDALVYYNKTAFAKAGINQAPTTWAEFAKDAKIMSEGKRHAFAVTLLHSYPWRAFFYAAGGQLADSSGQPSKSALSSSGAAGSALSLWADMAKNGSAIFTQGYASQTDFTNETSSILVGTSAFYPYVAESVGKKFQIGIAPIPRLAKQATALFGGYLAMFDQASTAQQDAGFTFIQYLTSEQGQVYWLEHSQGYLPVRRDAAAAAAGFLRAHPAQSAALAQVPTAEPAPNYSWYDNFDLHTLIPTIESVLLGRASGPAAASGLYSAAVSDAKSSQ